MSGSLDLMILSDRPHEFPLRMPRKPHKATDPHNPVHRTDPAPCDSGLEGPDRRMLTGLRAWVDILDAQGWNVAMRLPDQAPILSVRAQAWACRRSVAPICWHEISDLLAAVPPAKQLICDSRLLVWTEKEKRNAGPDANGVPLTKRQAEVLSWLHEGKTDSEIAGILGCAQRTIEKHVAWLYRKMGVRTRDQLLFQTRPNSP